MKQFTHDWLVAVLENDIDPTVEQFISDLNHATHLFGTNEDAIAYLEQLEHQIRNIRMHLVNVK